MFSVHHSLGQQGWGRGDSICPQPMWPGGFKIPVLTPYEAWVRYIVFYSAPRVFLRVLRFSPLLRKPTFQFSNLIGQVFLFIWGHLRNQSLISSLNCPPCIDNVSLVLVFNLDSLNHEPTERTAQSFVDRWFLSKESKNKISNSSDKWTLLIWRKIEIAKTGDSYEILVNCPPTPPPVKRLALREK